MEDLPAEILENFPEDEEMKFRRMMAEDIIPEQSIYEIPEDEIEQFLYCHESMEECDPIGNVEPTEEEEDAWDEVEEEFEDIAPAPNFRASLYSSTPVSSLDTHGEPNELVPWWNTAQGSAFDPGDNMTITASWVEQILRLDPLDVFLKHIGKARPGVKNSELFYIPINPYHAENVIKINTADLRLSLKPGRISQSEGLVGYTHCLNTMKTIYVCMRCLSSLDSKPFIDFFYDGVVQHLSRGPCCRNINDCLYM